ncbi:hypothetical protein K4K59_009904 [Colletotrichum sp. SAR11_240]|nr:hypothetical protein K4K59_009904 [Colletotrichum sp. SAR11_240]
MSAFLDGMDEATLQLVVQMQQEDIRELQDQSKGKAKETDRSDADVAFDTYEAELVSFRTFAADRALSRRIAHQEGTYPRVTTITAPAEQQAVPDASNPITSQPAESSSAEEIVAEEIVTEEILVADAVQTACNTDISDNDSIVDMPESSSWGASRETSKRTRSRKPTVISLSAQHLYLLPALKETSPPVLPVKQRRACCASAWSTTTTTYARKTQRRKKF